MTEKKVSPYYGEMYSDKKIKTRKTLAKICISGNDKVTPTKLLKWLCALKTDGWENLRIETRTEEGGEFQLDSEYIVFVGDRMETDQEFKDRQTRILDNWKREYEDFKNKEKFYTENPMGLAQLEELRRKKKVKWVP
jgi:hypothetical protein